MKKLLQISAIAVTLLPLGMTAFADMPTKTIMPITTSPNYFNGFYAGAGAGVNTLTNKESYIFSNSGDSYRANLFTRDFTGNIFAGYGKVILNHYHIGAELFVKYSPNKIDGITLAKPDESVTFGKVTNDYSYGADVRLGYLFSPKTMLYAFLGIDRAQFKIAMQGNNNDNLAKPLVVTNNFTKMATVTGIGLEAYLNDQLSLRSQYCYTQYHQFSYTIDFGDQSLTTEMHPSKSTFTLDLAYHFGN